MNPFNFTETPNSTGKVIDTITITTNDYLSFPTFFITKHGFNSVTAPGIKMFFDKEKGAVGILFVTEFSPGSYKVNYSDRYGATCKIKSFMLNNDLDAKKYAYKYAYTPHEASTLGLQEGTIFVIELRKDEDDR